MVAAGEKTAFQGRAIQILIRIADNGYLTTSQLIKIMGLQRSNISSYLTKLREEGFIETKTARYNRSVKPHSLTMKGREYLDTLL